MRIGQTSLLLCILVLVGVGSAVAAIPILKLDINHPDSNGAAETEEGFTPFTANDSGTTVNGVKVEFDGTLDSRSIVIFSSVGRVE